MIASREFVIKTMVSLLTNPKKKYSQNFLVDYKVVQKAVSSLNPDVKKVIEIGPGLGALTEEIINQGFDLTAYEIDKEMVEHLLSYFSNRVNFNVIKGDFLKQNLSIYRFEKTSFISNIPYNLTTPIIEKVLLSRIPIDSFVFMLQKEAADRIRAKFGSKDYGPLPIFLTYIGNVTQVCKVTRDKFIPSPNVDSVILKLEFRDDRNYNLERDFYTLLTNAFRMRRKTITNNIGMYFVNKTDLLETLAKANISPNARPEQLKLSDYLTLFETIKNKIK